MATLLTENRSARVNDLVITTAANNDAKAGDMNAIFIRQTGGAHRARDASNQEQVLVVKNTDAGTNANQTRMQLRC